MDAAIAYIRKLSPAGKAKAAEYGWRASEFVQTPVRSEFQQEPWFAQPSGPPSPVGKGPMKVPEDSSIKTTVMWSNT